MKRILFSLFLILFLTGCKSSPFEHPEYAPVPSAFQPEETPEKFMFQSRMTVDFGWYEMASIVMAAFDVHISPLRRQLRRASNGWSFPAARARRRNGIFIRIRTGPAIPKKLRMFCFRILQTFFSIRLSKRNRLSATGR